MTEAWQQLALAVLEPERFEDRLDAALRVVSEATGTPDGYLYLAEPSERRLRLAQTRARPAGDPTRAPAGPLPRQLEGGVEWSAPTVPLELVRSVEHEHERTVVTPVGPLHSRPLHEPDGRLLGVVQSGPVGGRGLRRSARRRLNALAAPLGLLLARARREETLRQRLAAAEVGLQASRRLAGAAVDLDRFVGLLLDLARTSTGARSGFVAIVERPGEPPRVRAAAEMTPGFAEQVDLSPAGGLFDWSLAVAGEDGGALVLEDVDAAMRLGLHAPVAVPLIERGEPLGIFALDFGPGATFAEGALELLETFARQVTLMLDNARLFSAFSDRYLDTVKGLAAALDARRPHTHDHHERVAAVAVAIARELGAGAEEAHALREAALVHDVGLAGAAAIEGGSDADVEHPTLGASLIEHLPLAPVVAGAVATHHEWFDGWGFPRGLQGEQIPRAGRILALAEFLVEMGTGDATRAPWPAQRLAEDVAQRRGSQFDPEVADAALRLAARGALDLAPTGA
ncbi:MAG TPA: HD domain-containing phosphohydrolase [Conexibacter sp.]|jgi:putative nucleotidyltransferase with HDIG domain|nr:HD domain-containing phosphohydrolase [Conexibacter sp.]